MYKDKDKQRKATRERVRRYRARHTLETDVTPCGTQAVTPNLVQPMCDEIVDVLHQRVLANPKVKIKPQSYNPMMVGYVPPKEKK